MAATAKHDLVTKFSADTNGEEDIAAIAKQISDHAEAIYQTWKSRGLAPTEILTCHSNVTAADKFGSALTPNKNINETPTESTCALSTVDILSQSPGLDSSNLEELVNNFVVEDKARIAASRQKSPVKTLPSSIQYALQKFESKSFSSQNQPIAAGRISPSQKQPTQPLPVVNSVSSPAPCFIKPSQLVKPQIPTKILQTADQHEVLLEAIETTFPNNLTHAKVEPKRPNSILIPQSGTVETHDSSPIPNTDSPKASGVTTWPLKNKLIESQFPKKAIARLPSSLTSPDDKSFIKDSNSNSDCYLDEVAREEERLINALKTGVVITEEHVERVTSPVLKQKPAIKEKPKVEIVKPIILSQSSPGNLVSAAMVHNITSSNNQPKTPSKDDLSAMSVVDYAKVRYQAAQQTPVSQKIIEDNSSQKNLSTIPLSSDHLISNAKNKFELENGKDNAKDDKETITSRWGPRINSPRPRIDQVPHPELTTQQKQHIRAVAATSTGNNPVRPFLTRGSVAERVLIFEKCPSELLLDKRGTRQSPLNTWRTGIDVQSKAQNYAKEKIQPKGLPAHTTLQRHIKANRNVHIPRFYFPRGKPPPVSQLEGTISKITAIFQSTPGHRVSRSNFLAITKACELPAYWKMPLFLACGGDKTGFVEQNSFIEFWKELSTNYHDAASKFVRITTRGYRNGILPEDLIPLVQDVVETHSGLTFLKEATEFHSRYVHTVIARIFYCVNRSWSGKISVPELRKSNLLSVISILEHEEDINQVTAYFSYEHFYVIYCKFWELDRDHDLFIDKMDLMRHNDNALSTRMIERIFSGAVTRSGATNLQQPEDKMSYTEFVWFLLSEEDKNHPTAIEYWFRCMDIDGDGFLSMYELEYFYEEQLHRMEAIGLETLPFEDCLCQMLDMIRPAIPGKISLNDLKKCKLTSIFFDTFFNFEKYLDHEQRDPFATARDHDAEGHELSDWDRFAAEEYELLVAEESNMDPNEQMLCDDEM